MAASAVLQKQGSFLTQNFIAFSQNGDVANNNRLSIEKKIEFLESLTGKVSNRRSRRWLNDRLLMELVPRLDAEEIRGLFTPPPWGECLPPSPFCMAKGEVWDNLRNVDMHKEERVIQALEKSLFRKQCHVDGKDSVLEAWHRIDSRARVALRRYFLSDLIIGYEECLCAFINGEDDVLVLHVQHPFHRLLLHGVCEFYNVISRTVTESACPGQSKKLVKIKKKNGSWMMPPIKLSDFIKASKV